MHEHPGREIESTFIQYGGKTVEDVAARLDVPVQKLERLIAGQDPVNVEMAIRLSAVLGYTVEAWLEKQHKYELDQVRKVYGYRLEKHLTRLVLPAKSVAEISARGEAIHIQEETRLAELYHSRPQLVWSDRLKSKGSRLGQMSISSEINGVGIATVSWYRNVQRRRFTLDINGRELNDFPDLFEAKARAQRISDAWGDCTLVELLNADGWEGLPWHIFPVRVQAFERGDHFFVTAGAFDKAGVDCDAAYVPPHGLAFRKGRAAVAVTDTGEGV